MQQQPLSDEQLQSYEAKFKTYDTEIENGIFNMIVSLCQYRAKTVGMDEAKKQVANWLDRIVNGLREDEKNIFGEK